MGYWIEMLVGLFSTVKLGIKSYSIEEGKQGKPVYKFDLEGDDMCFSIVNSGLGGKGDPKWGRESFKYTGFQKAFREFEQSLLDEIGLPAPTLFDEWKRKFKLKQYLKYKN